MNALAQSANVQYAVIRVSSTKAFPERIVIAYPNENALRDLIAAPSIIRLGFASQVEALASVDGDFPKTDVLRHANRRAIAVGNKKFQAPVMNGFLDDFSFSKGCEIARSFLHFVIASATLIFYSRNMVSTTIRAVLGGST